MFLGKERCVEAGKRFYLSEKTKSASHGDFEIFSKNTVGTIVGKWQMEMSAKIAVDQL